MINDASLKPISGDMADHIARVAARLFAARGFDATPVRTIVEAAGVTKPTLYYHFGSKEGLAQALLTHPMTAFVATLRACVGVTDDPVTNLAAQVESHFQFMRDNPDRGRFFYALFFGPVSTKLSSELAGFGRQIGEVMREGVERVVEAGIVDASRADAFCTTIHGTVVVHTMDFLYEKPACIERRPVDFGPILARTIVNDLIRGFGARPAPSPSPLRP